MPSEPSAAQPPNEQLHRRSPPPPPPPPDVVKVLQWSGSAHAGGQLVLPDHDGSSMPALAVGPEWVEVRRLLFKLRMATEQAARIAVQSAASSAPPKRVNVPRQMTDQLVACLALHHHRLRAAPGQAPLNPTQYTVLSLLLARSPGNQWPTMSLAELGRLAGTSQSNVKAVLRNLEERGLLQRRFASGAANTFDLSGAVDQLEALQHAEEAS